MEREEILGVLPCRTADQDASERQRARQLVPIHGTGHLPDAVLDHPSAALEKLEDAPACEESDVGGVQEAMRLVPEFPLDEALYDGEMLDVGDAGDQLPSLRRETHEGLQRLPWIIEMLQNIGTDHEVHRIRFETQSVETLGFDVPLEAPIDPGPGDAAEPGIQLHSRVAASREPPLHSEAGDTCRTADLGDIARSGLDQSYDVEPRCVVVFDPRFCPQWGSRFHGALERVALVLGLKPSVIVQARRCPIRLAIRRGCMRLIQGLRLREAAGEASAPRVGSGDLTRFLSAAIAIHLRQKWIRFLARISQARALSEP